MWYNSGMTSVAKIEQAVARLPPRDLAAFRTWFEEFSANNFDAHIAEDAREGRLDSLAEEALADLRRGDAREV